MSTLILSPFFFPEPISTGRFNTVLAQCLAKRGDAVQVIAAHPLYPRWRPEYSKAQLPGISIVRGGAWMRYPKSGVLRRLILESWYSTYTCVRYLQLKRRPKRVVAVFPPSLFFLFLAPLLARDTCVTGIVHDLQGVHAGSSPSAWRRRLQSLIVWVEKRGFSRCGRLIFLSRAMADYAIREYGLNPSRCVVRYPFITLPPHADQPSSALGALMPAGLIHIVYSGALGEKQRPDALLTFLSEVKLRHPDVRCHVFSAGPHYERLRNLHTNSGVDFHDLVNEEYLEELYARSSVQLIPQAPATSEGSIPSKLPNLLAAGVPIFAICDVPSEVSSILDKSGSGFYASSFSSVDLQSRFDSLLNSIAQETRNSRIERLRGFIEDNFSVENFADAILKG